MKLKDVKIQLKNKGMVETNKSENIKINYLIAKYGYTKILFDYSIPFIKDYEYPSGTNMNNFLLKEWSYASNTYFVDIYSLFEFDTWFGNYITEILHESENVLKGAFKNVLTENLNMEDEFTFSFENNDKNTKFLSKMWHLSDSSNNNNYNSRIRKIFSNYMYFIGDTNKTWQDRIKNHSILEWINTMTFGDFLDFLDIWRKKNNSLFLIMLKTFFSSRLYSINLNNKNKFSSLFRQLTSEPEMFMFFYYCIRDLRNQISHNNVVYNFRFFNFNKFKKIFMSLNEEDKKNKKILFLTFMEKINDTSLNNLYSNGISNVNTIEENNLIIDKYLKKYTTYNAILFIVELLNITLQSERKRIHNSLLINYIRENIENFLNSISRSPSAEEYIRGIFNLGKI